MKFLIVLAAFVAVATAQYGLPAVVEGSKATLIGPSGTLHADTGAVTNHGAIARTGFAAAPAYGAYAAPAFGAYAAPAYGAYAAPAYGAYAAPSYYGSRSLLGLSTPASYGSYGLGYNRALYPSSYSGYYNGLY